MLKVFQNIYHISTARHVGQINVRDDAWQNLLFYTKAPYKYCIMKMACFLCSFCCKQHINITFQWILLGGFGDLDLDYWPYFVLLSDFGEMLICRLKMTQSFFSNKELIFFQCEIIIFQFLTEDKGINICNI